ncbi:hypothetical protein GUJ93_ZPchr0012g20513 [Zizania palustris]|uniref:Uncharacterized protein n=1 Tax=Zizania palustris TaxID=103762 RepID=A0A8J5WR81_ZIZPA|nr:hypothetical protein GUJ93_ZPchr0012g20513 [Zizania palustris]
MLVHLRCTHVGQSSNRHRVHAERSFNPQCATHPIPLVRCLASHTACPADTDVHALSSGALAEAPAIQRSASQRSSGARPMLQPSSGTQPCSSSVCMLRWPARAQVHACSRPSHPQRSCSGACSSPPAVKTQDPPPKYPKEPLHIYTVEKPPPPPARLRASVPPCLTSPPPAIASRPPPCLRASSPPPPAQLPTSLPRRRHLPSDSLPLRLPATPPRLPRRRRLPLVSTPPCLASPRRSRWEAVQDLGGPCRDHHQGIDACDLEIRHAQCNNDERMLWISIVDSHKSCKNCNYDLCLSCCQELQDVGYIDG